MKGVKGRLVKKLKTVKAIGYPALIKPEIILQVNMHAIQGYFSTSFSKSAITRQPFSVIEQPGENLLPEMDEPPTKTRKVNNPLDEFPLKCPPGGSDCVILYTTSLRGVRKTFEDCQKVRSLLENMRVVFVERDLSMHCEFKQELWGILEGKALPPKLFVKGRCIGGAEEVVGLHERGEFRALIEGIPVDRNDGPCEGCAGFKFIICFNCHGSRKSAVRRGGDRGCCSNCNENGILICPYCC